MDISLFANVILPEIEDSFWEKQTQVIVNKNRVIVFFILLKLFFRQIEKLYLINKIKSVMICEMMSFQLLLEGKQKANYLKKGIQNCMPLSKINYNFL
ncbi:hypothetical protein D0809_17190 [Flavobacterium circumlabens]|uniref:Uncharacterized protein n=1 Tax=Flavobacterium circumlabens TaxID=2133765 RepID=A0A4Y7U9R7_9FLAO|nr:hypothetical protein EV142_106104 [Flavobacterium circumlabens]TEB43165.1 hypothetical protein D0809_17190 [Flavobacterium circumlabens]